MSATKKRRDVAVCVVLYLVGGALAVFVGIWVVALVGAFACGSVYERYWSSAAVPTEGEA